MRSHAIKLVIAPVFGLLAIVAAAVAAERAAVVAPAPNLYPVVNGARLGGDENQTRFIADLSRKVDLHAFTLADPYRVVIDIPQVTFKLAPKAGEIGRGLVK